jgi:hypothetical protein
LPAGWVVRRAPAGLTAIVLTAHATYLPAALNAFNVIGCEAALLLCTRSWSRMTCGPTPRLRGRAGEGLQRCQIVMSSGVSTQIYNHPPHLRSLPVGSPY